MKHNYYNTRSLIARLNTATRDNWLGTDPITRKKVIARFANVVPRFLSLQQHTPHDDIFYSTRYARAVAQSPWLSWIICSPWESPQRKSNSTGARAAFPVLFLHRIQTRSCRSGAARFNRARRHSERRRKDCSSRSTWLIRYGSALITLMKYLTLHWDRYI